MIRRPLEESSILLEQFEPMQFDTERANFSEYRQFALNEAESKSYVTNIWTLLMRLNMYATDPKAPALRMSVFPRTAEAELEPFMYIARPNTRMKGAGPPDQPVLLDEVIRPKDYSYSSVSLMGLQRVVWANPIIRQMGKTPTTFDVLGKFLAEKSVD